MAKPVLSDPIALRLPVDILESIEKIAETTDRSRSWVIVRALKYYLLAEGADVLAVAKGEQEIDNGEFEDMDALLGELSRSVRTDAA